MRLLAGVRSQQVAPVVGAKVPGELELDERVEAAGRVHSPTCAFEDRLTSRAYLDGCRRTVGFGISWRRLISLIHWCGLRIALTCLASLEFVPYIGWKP